MENNNSGFKKFISENKSLLVTIPIFVVLIVAVILIYVGKGRDDSAMSEVSPSPTPVLTPGPAPSGTEVVVLPEPGRDKTDEQLRNPFASPYKVSGIMYDDKGSSMAIVEAENKSFVLLENQWADDLFILKKIEKDRIIIEVEGEEIVLSLSN